MQWLDKACNIVLSTESTDVELGARHCKHNCVARVRSATPWLVLPPARPEHHGDPIFKKPIKEITDQVLSDGGGKRTIPASSLQVVFKPAGWVCDQWGVDARCARTPEKEGQRQREQLSRQHANASLCAWICLHYADDRSLAATQCRFKKVQPGSKRFEQVQRHAGSNRSGQSPPTPRKGSNPRKGLVQVQVFGLQKSTMPPHRKTRGSH